MVAGRRMGFFLDYVVSGRVGSAYAVECANIRSSASESTYYTTMTECLRYVGEVFNAVSLKKRSGANNLRPTH